MKNIVLYSTLFMMFSSTSFYSNCFEAKASSKKTKQSFACSQHGKKCNGQHGTRSKK